MPDTSFFTAKHCRPAIVAAGFILTAALTIGSFSGSARAQWHDGDRQWHDGNRQWHDVDRHDRHHRDWDRHYYRAPPVVYGRPYYAPPVVYGSPYGLSINIR